MNFNSVTITCAALNDFYISSSIDHHLENKFILNALDLRVLR